MHKPFILCLAAVVLVGQHAAAFCGFYVSQADTKLFNEASKVVVVRDGDRTVITMVNDFQGDLTEFALVVPVPTFLEEGQIHVSDIKYVDHLDAYTAPRLVEYHDRNPCERLYVKKASRLAATATDEAAILDEIVDDDLGVTVEATYTVGEYDIKILSAKESDGLETWLLQNKYKVPEGASKVLGSYIKQNMRFFVAKVNVKQQSKLGFNYLRPLQVAYESPKFMLPIRLGTINSKGEQELFAFVLSKQGRVETTNYRTVKIPTNLEMPLYLRDDKTFGDFYKAMFDKANKDQRGPAVFMEYAWDMAWCDPCAANPLSREELRQLGVFWLPETSQRRGSKAAAQNVYVTRLHVRYDGESFPEDLVFQQTGDRTNFQGRYILRHPWKGQADCPEAVRYFEQLATREEQQAQNLARVTGWDITKIRAAMGNPGNGASKYKPEDKWWKKIWKD
jgi:hypothetical protein